MFMKCLCPIHCINEGALYPLNSSKMTFTLFDMISCLFAFLGKSEKSIFLIQIIIWMKNPVYQSEKGNSNTSTAVRFRNIWIVTQQAVCNFASFHNHKGFEIHVVDM